MTSSSKSRQFGAKHLLYYPKELISQSVYYVKKNWKHLLINFSAIVFLVVLWYVLVTSARGGNPILLQHRFDQLPTPGETWDAFVKSLAPSEGRSLIHKFTIQEHASASIVRVLIGFTLASIIGIPSGIIMARYRYAQDFGSPIVELFRPIPPLAWIGVGLLIFSLNVGYFIVFIGCLFPLILSTIAGVRAIDETLIEAAETLGASKYQILTKVVIPGSMPSIVTGMRIGLGIGWMSIVAAEMVGMRSALGIGNYLWVSYNSYGYIDRVVSAMIIIGFIGWVMNTVIQKVEKRVIRWQE